MAKRKVADTHNPKLSAFEKTLKHIPDLILNANARIHVTKSTLAPIKACTNFVFIGTGSSFHSALWGAELFKHYGLQAQAIEAFDALQDTTQLGPKSAFILISHRGARGLTGALIKKLSPSQKKRTLLLCGKDSTSGGGIKTIHTSPAEISQAHSISLMGTMSCTSVLAQLLKPKTTKNEPHFRKYVAQYIKKHTSSDLLRSRYKTKKSQSLHFVGAGPFLAIAKEAALKAMEMTHVPALSHHLEGFLHGPLTAVNKNDLVIILGTKVQNNKTSTEQKRIDAALKALKVLKAQGVRVQPPESLPSHWQAACALALLQRALLELSLALKLNPDLNRQEDSRYKRAAQVASFVL